MTRIQSKLLDQLEINTYLFSDYGWYNDTMTLSFNHNGIPNQNTTRGKWRCKHCFTSKCRKKWCSGTMSDEYWKLRLPYLAVRVPYLPIGSKLPIVSFAGTIYYCSQWNHGGCRLYLTGTPSIGWPRYISSMKRKWNGFDAAIKFGWKRWKNSNSRWKSKLPRLCVNMPIVPDPGTSLDYVICVGDSRTTYHCTMWNEYGRCMKYATGIPRIGWGRYSQGLRHGWRYLMNLMLNFNPSSKRGGFKLPFNLFGKRGKKRQRWRFRFRSRGRKHKSSSRKWNFGLSSFSSGSRRHHSFGLNHDLNNVYWDLRLPNIALKVSTLPFGSKFGVVMFDGKIWYCSKWNSNATCSRYSKGRPPTGWNRYFDDYRRGFGLDIMGIKYKNPKRYRHKRYTCPISKTSCDENTPNLEFMEPFIPISQFNSYPIASNPWSMMQNNHQDEDLELMEKLIELQPNIPSPMPISYYGNYINSDDEPYDDDDEYLDDNPSQHAMDTNNPLTASLLSEACMRNHLGFGAAIPSIAGLSIHPFQIQVPSIASIQGSCEPHTFHPAPLFSQV